MKRDSYASRVAISATIAFGWVGTLKAAPATPVTPTPVGPKVAALIEQLGADDVRQRDEAAKQLEGVGEAGRGALVQAARRADLPEVRARATRLLVTMSWAAPDDPPTVRQRLQDYRNSDADQRIAAVQRMAEDTSAFRAMVRLLAEEPVEDVRWAIAQQMRRFTDEAHRQRLRDLVTTASSDDAPTLVAAGWAWHAADPAKGAEILRRAVDVAAAHPCNDQGELDLVLQTLYSQAINNGRYNDAAHVMRQLGWRNESLETEPLLTLFWLHAQYGPLEYFDRDLEAFGDRVEQPELMYVLGHMHARLGRPLVAAAMYQAAAAANLGDPNGHQRVGKFLTTRGWNDLARTEYELVLAAPGPDKEIHDADALVGLARCAAAGGEEVAAARHLEKALDTLLHLPGRMLEHEREFRAEIDWHYLRDAKERKDWDEAARRVNRLVRTPVNNPEMAIDIVTSLKAMDRAPEAASLFKTFYTQARQQLDQDPKDPEALNNIAWLCARCGEYLQEAHRWSVEAVTLAPSNAAYLDTAGEAAADVGKWDEAIKYESMALRLQPGDRFMTSQLERFRKGKAESGAK